jgi:uncharacterized protein YbjT (DUF2867 family)
MTSTAVVGSTGLVVSFSSSRDKISLQLRPNTPANVPFQGSHILSTLLSHPSIASVHALARRQPASTDSKLHSLVSTDSDQWPAQLSAVSPPPAIFFSALGTTRGAAGSLEKQRKIDYDLNLSLAKAAKASGVKVYVLISSNGALASSRLPYLQMKGELEDSVKALDFEHTVLLRPGLIVGDRQETRLGEAVARNIAKLAGALGNALKDPWAQVYFQECPE